MAPKKTPRPSLFQRYVNAAQEAVRVVRGNIIRGRRP